MTNNLYCMTNNMMYTQMIKDTLYCVPSTNNTVELRLVMKQSGVVHANKKNDDDYIAMGIVFTPHVTDITRYNVVWCEEI